MQTILIAGCGDVGTALGLRLAARGHRVLGLRRSPGALPDTIEPIAADLTQPDTLRRVPTEIDVLFYTAAAAGRTEAAYRAAYVDGLANVLAVVSGPRLARAFFTSSTGVYGQDDGGWVDENSPCAPDRFTGRVLLEGEARLAASSVPATCVRFGGIYGPGRHRLIERARSGAPCDPGLWTNRIHRDDCAGVLAHLYEAGASPGVYVGVDCEPAPQCAVMDWLADALGVMRPPRDADAGGARGGSKRCSNRKLLDTGYAFAYPTFREGYRQVLEAMR